MTEKTCQFNCRTQKEAFRAGWESGARYVLTGIIGREDAIEEAMKDDFREWKQERSE